jgi:hypothetical protein
VRTLFRLKLLVSVRRFSDALERCGFLRVAWWLDEVSGWNAMRARLPQIKRDLGI